MPKRFPASSVVCLSEKDGVSVAPSALQICRAGKFNDWMGAFEITEENLSSMVRNFSEGVRGVDIPINYFHDRYGKAAAWIKRLSTRNNGTELWAEGLKWCPAGKKAVEDGEIRYLSAEIDWDYQDNESGRHFGATLLGAGFTNVPFVKGMEPATELDERDRFMSELEKAQAQIKELSEKLKGSEAAQKQITELSDRLKVLETENAELKKAKADADAKAEADKKTAERKGKFDAMLSEGKVCEAQREPWMSGDMEKFASLSEKVNPTPAGVGSAPGKVEIELDSKSKTPAQDKVLELAEKRAEEKKLPIQKAIKEILSENPDLKKKYDAEASVR